ncbi:MAG: AAA family ATPase [Acidimicrobiales bacterium]|nr:AAA family ATPase [Acidimicrobiales bacterium]
MKREIIEGPSQEAFRSVVAAVRDALHLSQAGLAKAMGVSSATLSGGLSGSRPVTIDTVERLAAAIDELRSSTSSDDRKQRLEALSASAHSIAVAVRGGPTTSVPKQARRPVRSSASLQDRLEHDRLAYFVARDEETAHFATFLNDARGRRAVAVLALTADGGYGKTTLIARLRQEAHDRRWTSAYAQLRLGMGPFDIMSQWKSSLEPHPGPLYGAAVVDYEQAAATHTNATDNGDTLPPVGGMVTGAMGDAAELYNLGAQLGGAAADILTQARRRLTNAFLQDLHPLFATHDGVCLIVDDYHLASRATDDWTRAVLLSSPNFVGPIAILISGRQPLEEVARDWGQWHESIEQIPLGPLDDSGVASYVDRRLPTASSEVVKAVAAASSGVPWLLAIAVDELLAHPEASADTVDEILRGRLLPRVLSHFDASEPGLVAVIEAAALFRQFDEDMVAHVIGRPAHEHLAFLRTRVSFLRPSPDGWTIDDPIADHVASDLRVRAPDRYRELCAKATRACEERLLSVDQATSRGQRLRTLRLVLLAQADLPAAIAELRLATSRVRGVLVADDVSDLVDAVRATSIDAREHPELKAISGLAHLSSGRYDAGYFELEDVLSGDDPRLPTETRIAALTGLVDVCHRRAAVGEALPWCTEGLALARAEGLVDAEAVFLARLAETYGVLGRRVASTQAIKECERLLAEGAVAEDVAAEALIVLSYVYAMRNEWALARARADAAVARAQQLHEAVIRALADSLASWTHTMDGDVAHGLVRARGARRFFRELKDEFQVAVATLNTAELLRCADDITAAERWTKLVLTRFADVDGEGYRLNILSHQAETLLLGGRPQEVVELLDFLAHDAPDLYTDDRYHYGLCLLHLATARRRMTADEGLFAEACTVLGKSQNVRGRLLARHWEAYLAGAIDDLRHVALEAPTAESNDVAAVACHGILEVQISAGASLEELADLTTALVASALRFNVFYGRRMIAEAARVSEALWPELAALVADRRHVDETAEHGLFRSWDSARRSQYAKIRRLESLSTLLRRGAATPAPPNRRRKHA